MRHNTLHATITLKHGEPRTITLFDTGLSATVAREILDGNAYPLVPEDVLPADSVQTIYDVGANLGASCIYWCDSYPHAKVHAYEPCMDAYELLAENTVRLHVDPYNIALGAEDGFATLYHNVEDDCCNSLHNHQSGSHESVVVDRARAHIHGPVDILKIDTEGCEYEILADIEAWLPDFKVLYLEYHSESDRIHIGTLLKRTHTLWHSRSDRPHRGTQCYVRKDLIPAAYNDWTIT